MEIKTLEGVSIKDIAAVFNESFSDYFIPFHLSEDQLRTKMKADKVRLDYSVGVFDDELLVAFILHGLDQVNGENKVYNGGTGVIPCKRGKGLTRAMYQFIIPKLKNEDVDSLQLEVISENIPAIKSYEKTGYKVVRELVCFKGKLQKLSTNSDIQLRPLKSYDWNTMQSFWDTTPTWQNSNRVLNEMIKTNTSYGAYFQNTLVGYVIYNNKNSRLQQIGVHRNHRNDGIASTLLSKIKESHGAELSIINVDKDSDGIIGFLVKIGLQRTLEQLEMRFEL